MIPCVSIILVSYNSLEYLEECIICLKNQTWQNIEIVLVDNCSSDGTQSWVKKNYPDIILVESSENLGYAAGNNLGAAHASGELLLILNNDIACDETFVEILAEKLLQDDTIGITTPLIAFYNNKEMINSFGNEIHLSGLVTCSEFGKNVESIKKDRYVHAASGCAFMISQKMYKDLKGFDENYWLSMEDTDLAWRLRSKNKKILGCCSAVLYHKYIPKLHEQKIYNIETGRYYFLVKNFPLVSIVLLFPLFIFVEILMCSYYALINRKILKYKLRSFLYIALKMRNMLSSRRNNKNVIQNIDHRWCIDSLVTDLNLGAAVDEQKFKIPFIILNTFFLLYKKIIYKFSL